MADDSQVLRGIHWRETFPVTHVFRAFRVALEPTKMLLALLTLLLVVIGGFLLDHCWPHKYRAATNEIAVYADMSYRGEPAGALDQWRGEALAAGSTTRGPFKEFFIFESSEVYRVINGVRVNNWLGGIGNQDESGVIASAIGFFTIAPAWAIVHHTVFFVLFGIYFLVIWAVFGGAIARIAAVEVAREEKPSIRTALRFSLGKFLSFAFAPIIPLLIILFIGLAVFLVTLAVGNIPWIGPVVVGAVFLALAAGFVCTLVLIGTVGGLNLMYPTVAVEGSDSFDAISRSFSYVYTKPWRMLFYTLVAVLYGSLTFLFVRFFIQTMLFLAHAFVGWGIARHTPAGDSVWGAMWPFSPARMYYRPDWHSLTWDQQTGAALIWCWVMLCLSLLGAFAISFYFSANTIIYYLMRREVDATELDDVYVEQSDEDFGEMGSPTGDAPAASALAAAETTAAASAPATEAPASSEPAPPAGDAP